MPVGLQVFDDDGNLLVDFTTRLARVLASVNIVGNTPGSITDGRLVGGDVFYAFQPSSLVSFIGNDITRPNFSISGQTISWFYSPPSSPNNTGVGGTMFYGVR